MVSPRSDVARPAQLPPRGSRAEPELRVAAESKFTLAEMSGDCARRWPTATALHDANGSISFHTLHQASQRLARLLIAFGVQKGDRVVVLGTKDIQTVVAILAAVEAGAVYVPVDPNLPEMRLKFILEDAAPRLVLGRARLYPLTAGRMFLETDHCADPNTLLRDEWRHEVLPQVSPQDVAYLMYTSGSTGYPKGVLIAHQSIEAFFLAHKAGADIQPGDRCMNTGPFHFDVSILDVFLPLFCGASVVLTPEVPMPKLLLRTIELHRITHFYAVGTILALMTGDGRWLDQFDLSSLRMLQTGAEVCNARVVNEWLKRLPSLCFLNSYGPTEVTVGCLYYRKPDCGPLNTTDVPIGSLHQGSTALLIDAEGRRISTPGTHGELLLAGTQVMRGYWKRSSEEATSFATVEGQTYYRTGDIVYLSDEGLLHYVGRRDDEVKIDGCRIHLNEVKRSLESHATVRIASVFLVLNRHRRPRVAAAIVPHGEFDADSANRLLSKLSGELPQVALPIALLACGELPRSATGKTDTRALTKALQRALSQYVARSFVLSGDEAIPLEQQPSAAVRVLKHV